MLNNHEANLTDEEAAAEVARVAKIYPVVRRVPCSRALFDGRGRASRFADGAPDR